MAIELDTYQEPTIVRLTDEERLTGKLSDENIALGVLGFNRDGLVILENAVDTELCDKLDEIMQKEADDLLKDPKATWNDVSTPNACRPKLIRFDRQLELPPRNAAGISLRSHPSSRSLCTKTSGQTRLA